MCIANVGYIEDTCIINTCFSYASISQSIAVLSSVYTSIVMNSLKCLYTLACTHRLKCMHSLAYKCEQSDMYILAFMHSLTCSTLLTQKCAQAGIYAQSDFFVYCGTQVCIQYAVWYACIV